MPSNCSTDEEGSDSGRPESDICPKQAQGESCAACDATAAIDQEIYQAENSLALLKHRRLLLLGNMNNVHDPLVSRLPIEVIARIFSIFLPVNVDKRYSIICPEGVPSWETPTTPLVLGAVCRTWRSVVWSIPKLWTSISVNIYHSHGRLVDMVGEWLERSGRLPLHIHLYATPGCEAHRRDSWASYCSSPPYGSEPYITRLMDMSNACSERWFYLDITLPRSYMEQVQFTKGRLERLNTLKLEAIVRCATKAPTNDREFGEDLKVDNIPNLRNVCVRGFYFHQLNINFQSLTCVEAAKIPAGTCLQLFQTAPFLTHCTFWDVTISYGIYDRHDLVRHCNLLFLYAKGGWSHYILRLTGLPASEHLATDIHMDSLDDICGFIERSSCLLKSAGLEMGFLPIGYQTERLITFVRAIMPLSLETLELDCTYSTPYMPVEPSINSETQAPVVNDGPFLPNLKNLRIIIREHPWNSYVTLTCDPDGLSPFFSTISEPGKYFYIVTLSDQTLNTTYLPDLMLQRDVPLFIQNRFGEFPSDKQRLSSSFVDFIRLAPSQYQLLSPLILKVKEHWNLSIFYLDT